MKKEVEKAVKYELRKRFKLAVLEYAKYVGSAKSCREFDVSFSTFYEWKKKHDSDGASGLNRKKPIAYYHPQKTSPEIINKILELRKEYKLGSLRITYYLARYHDIKVSESTVYRVLKKHKLNNSRNSGAKRSIHTKRYSKNVPGHHIQVDVKFVHLKDMLGKSIRRYQYTAIDDATRIRALKIYKKHNQDYAIKFIDYVVKKFPFRIHTIRTDRGHEFQMRFHCHAEDLGMMHTYIKPRTPQLNGKVERSHQTDDREFYQLLTYKDDVDLVDKLNEWEYYYNYERPHISHKGKTPYEVMKSLLVKK